MKKNEPRKADNVITPSCGNIFIDIGFDPAEAHLMAMRVELMVRLEQHIAAQKWTQAEAAKRLGTTQSRISRIIRGNWQEFSLDMLLIFAARLGLEPELHLAA